MIAIVTGSGGLIGSEMCRFLLRQGWNVVGVDNDSRKVFFGDEGTTKPMVDKLIEDHWAYKHAGCDIRSFDVLENNVFKPFAKNIGLVVHTAAQPAHDYTAKFPLDDLSINVVGTSVMLELTRRHCPEAPFIFTSSSKVYNPNNLEYQETNTRFWPTHLPNGIPETFPVDQAGGKSLFGAHKTAADIIAQEYAYYFGLKVGVFRCGCLTGPNHSAVEMHGFLNYLVRCAKKNKFYTIYGYGGKQVRDNIHSEDLISAFYEWYKNPKPGVYNIGGGIHANCSILEAINITEELTGKSMNVDQTGTPRVHDHKWYVSDIRKFSHDYPMWRPQWGIEDTIRDIYEHTN